MGDFNNDGHDDIVAMDWSEHSVFLGNGDGTFGPESRFPAMAVDNRSIDSGDLDGDGNLDVVINSSAGQSLLAIHYGDGAGGFSSNSTDTFGGLLTNENVHMADIDADGDLDIVSGGWSVTARVFVNNGSRTFTPAASIGNVFGLLMLAEDLNGDGAADIITNPGGNSDTLEVRLNDGAGGFNTPTPYQGAPGPRHAVLTDVNADGKADVALVNALVFGPVALSNNVTIMLGNGDGTFATPYNIPGYRNNMTIDAGNFD